MGTDTLGNRLLRDVVFNLSGGWYWQPAFYREMRDLQGQVNPDIRAQRALHLIAGVNYRFNWHDRPFILNTEAYHKDWPPSSPMRSKTCACATTPTTTLWAAPRDSM